MLVNNVGIIIKSELISQVAKYLTLKYLANFFCIFLFQNLAYK